MVSSLSSVYHYDQFAISKTVALTLLADMMTLNFLMLEILTTLLCRLCIDMLHPSRGPQNTDAIFVPYTLIFQSNLMHCAGINPAY